METINFTKCTLALLEERALLRPMLPTQATALKAWLQHAQTLTDFEEQMLQLFSSQLEINAFHWREYDLSMHFIGPLFSLVNFTVLGQFNLFAQESFEAEVTATVTKRTSR
jgi:hypothetical protein